MPLTPEEQLEVQRQAVLALVEEGLSRGLSPTRISYATGDASFVSKLRAGHKHKLSTLISARRQIGLLLNPPTPSFLQDSA